MLSDSQVMACFESLGGCGRGAEFGFAQHHYGATQPGLLRNSDLGLSFLIHALTQRFKGIGTPGQMIVFEHEQDAEWWTRDTQYWMATRSNIRIADTPEPQARHELQHQLTTLASKMIEDLEAGNRVFVYRDLYANPDAGKRSDLFRAVRAYGNAPLLILQQAVLPAQAATVEQVEPGLFLGHLAHFAFSPDGQPLGSVHDALLGICRATLALLAASGSHIGAAAGTSGGQPSDLHPDATKTWQGAAAAPSAGAAINGFQDNPSTDSRAGSEHQATRTALVEAFQAVLRHPGSAPAYADLATLLHASADFTGAEEAARTAIRLAPGDAHHHYQLSVALMQQECWPDAVQAARTAAEREPANLLRLVHLAALQLAAGDLDGAAATQRSLADRDPLGHGTLLIGTIVHRRNARLDEALTSALELTRRYPDSQEGLAQLAEARMARNEWQKAAIVVEAGLQRYPSDASLMALRQRILAA